MKAVSKTVIACSIAAASLFGATANAAVFNPFEVNPLGNFANFTADKITGNYSEIATFNEDDTFNVSLHWRAGQFVTNGGNDAYDAAVTGLGDSQGYGIYALYKASGTVVRNGDGSTTFLFDQAIGSSSLSMYLDVNRNSMVTTRPETGSGDFVVSNTGDDILLATGAALDGEGTLDPSLSTCTSTTAPGSNGINCGSFGSDTSFLLTDDGLDFFVKPFPFYTLSFQSGQLNNFTPSGTQNINGSLDVVFSAPGEVPEPASVGLLGLGMLGLYAARRRNKKAA